jgi:hypothetical protein
LNLRVESELFLYWPEFLGHIEQRSFGFDVESC